MSPLLNGGSHSRPEVVAFSEKYDECLMIRSVDYENVQRVSVLPAAAGWRQSLLDYNRRMDGCRWIPELACPINFIAAVIK